ncbi:MAG: ABC transporter permease [Hydrogenophilales bacterium]|nr:ABC transporter permease [Hydrogenophilales bacterium]
MRSLLAQHRAAAALTVQRMLAAPLATMLTLSVIGIALSLPLGLYLMVDNLGRVAANTQGQPEISLFLKDSAGSATQRDIEAKLDVHDGVNEYRFVPREAALKTLSKNMGITDAAAVLGKNPLPDAFVVGAKQADPDALEQLRKEMQAWSGVQTAKLDSDWARRLNAFLRLGRDGVWLLGALLGFALAAVGFNTIRLQVLAKRDEIEVSRLLGATDAFIRRPYLYLGTLQGLLGGLTGWLIVAGAFALINLRVAEIAGLYGMNFLLEGLALNAGVLVLVLSGLLGWAGAYLAANQHLRGGAAAI